MSSDNSNDDVTAIDVATGSFEEAQEWVGRSGDTFFAAEPVNRSMIQFYAELIEDANPSFWDERFAANHWGAIRSPPGLFWTWKMDPEWTPGPDAEGADGEDVSVTDVPLPGGKDTIINTQSKTTIHRPLLVGTQLNWQTSIESVSEEKETRVGTGNFVTEKTTYRDGGGELVAEESNVMLRYSADDEEERTESFETPFAEGRRAVDVPDGQGPDDPYASIDIDEVSPGDGVDGFEFPVTYTKVVHNAAATRDFSGHHHDPEYTRSRGNETIFLNTMALQGLADRVAVQWAGPEWRIAEREIAIQGTAYAGDKLSVGAEVTDVDENEGRIELGVTMDNDGRDVCPSSVTLVRDGVK
ncbi:hypothetical protein C448_12281 [Halococcus morrhuae DSM 1307]|uniref:FAS1-like dehydratase domain-containing protein n=1 Tax=Halococcus morrhuae DSM 1307 TaxID=931277 RepID=M0M6K0_HALMO|nr:MaoC family dehydratase N-terminal domain-containing protein [Halococcus morrhuae]EMA41346.1 hypothetical protein C448_12281 [Halococcus morrhuae DSM 1307]